jgi:hypothetical protein
MGKRSQADELLAQAFAEGETVDGAAKRANCSRSTAWRRWNEAPFRERVRELQEQARRERQAVLHRTWVIGTRLLPAGLAALQDTLQDPDASHLDRARAARILLRQFAPREEPAPVVVPSVEQEQRAAREAEDTRRLFDQFDQLGNVHQLRPPEPAWTPPPQPTRPPPPPVSLEPAEAEDDDELEVHQEDGKIPVPEARGAPEPDPDPEDPEPAEAPPLAAEVARWKPPRYVTEDGRRVRRDREPVTEVHPRPRRRRRR